MEGEVVFAFVGTRLVLLESSAGPRPPSFDELSEAVGPETLTSGRVPGRLPGPSGSVAVFALPDDLELPGDFRLDGLRVAYHVIGHADFRATDALTLSGGIDYAFFKYDFLQDTEREDVWTYWLDARWKYSKRFEFRARASVDEDDFHTYTTFEFSVTVRF